MFVQTNTGSLPTPKIEYELQYLPSGVKVTCTFLDPDIPECVVVVHQKLPTAHLNISLYYWGRSGNIISGDVYVGNPEAFQISVLGGREVTKSVHVYMCKL